MPDLQRANLPTNLSFRGGKVQFRDRLGQEFIRLLFSVQLDPVTSIRAAKGWLDDQITIYSFNKKPTALIWKIKWANRTEAIEFLKAWIAYVSALTNVKIQFTEHFQVGTTAGTWTLNAERDLVTISHWK